MIEKLIDGIKGRIEYYPFKDGLNSLGLNAGIGWDGTVDRLLRDRDRADNKTEFDNKLSGYVQDIIFSSNKSFSFYPFIKEDLTVIQASINGLSNNIVVDTTLQMLDNALMFAERSPKFAFKLNATTIVFVSKRKQEHRVNITINDRVKEFLSLNNLTASSKLVAFDSSERLCFDFVRVCTERKTLELAIDYGTEMRANDRLNVESELYGKISALLGISFPPAINIFSVIESTYNLPSEIAYKIVELNFLTDDDYSHRVSGRGRTEPRDVRQDAYHIAGSQGEAITPYQIAMQISIGDYKRSELMLKSNAGMVQSDKTSKLTSAFIINCYNSAQIDSCLDYIYNSISIDIDDENVESTAA